MTIRCIQTCPSKRHQLPQARLRFSPEAWPATLRYPNLPLPDPSVINHLISQLVRRDSPPSPRAFNKLSMTGSFASPLLRTDACFKMESGCRDKVASLLALACHCSRIKIATLRILSVLLRADILVEAGWPSHGRDVE
jgi:hypothetical protein